MQHQQQTPDGSWTPAQPLPLTADFDAEVYGTGPWTWIAYRGGIEVAYGRARTRVGTQAALVWARISTRVVSRP